VTDVPVAACGATFYTSDLANKCNIERFHASGHRRMERPSVPCEPRSLAPARGLRIVNRPAAHSHLAHLRASTTRPGPRYNVGRTSAMSAESKILAPLYVHRQREESSGRRGNVVFLALGICTITVAHYARKGRNMTHVCSE